MAELTEIRWHGRGGQGVVTGGKLLAEAALAAGQYFQAFPDYGPERMGAPIRAYTRISSEPITIHSQIEEPDVVLVLDPTLLGTVAVTEGLERDGILLVNTPMSPAEVREATGFSSGQVFTVDASHIAIEEMGREITNAPMLGALARATGLFGVEELAEHLRAWFGTKISAEMVQANVRAMRRAAETVRPVQLGSTLQGFPSQLHRSKKFDKARTDAMELKGWKDIPIGGVILAAGNAVEYRTGGWRAFRPVRGEAECTHCMQCWLFCPDSSILVDSENEKMIGFDLEHCKGCGICASVCPVNARADKRAGKELERDEDSLCIRMIEEGRSEE